MDVGPKLQSCLEEVREQNDRFLDALPHGVLLEPRMHPVGGTRLVELGVVPPFMVMLPP